MFSESGGPEFQERRIVSECKVLFPTKEEAMVAVREFWTAMPHGSEAIRYAEQSGGYDQELTFSGDRTSISRAGRDPKNPRVDQGWQVRIAGNHQPLSREAAEYLASKGLV